MVDIDGRKRVVIENVVPEINCGRFAIKRVVGEKVVVVADIFGDGHDELSASLLYKKDGDARWHEAPMKFRVNDKWEAEFIVKEKGLYYYTVEAWIDHFKTWQHDLGKKFEAEQDISVALLIGANLIKEAAERAESESKSSLKSWASSLEKEKNQTVAFEYAMNENLTKIIRLYPDKRLAKRYKRELPAWVDRKEAVFSTWYELFPRSTAEKPGKHGTFADCERLLPRIAAMGFDVLYFPPIHPIGSTARKGKNNAVTAKSTDPGSPWAIGSEQGGHKAIHPELGTMDDFGHLVNEAKKYGIEIALDIAFQCSPDHPYVREHPEWFRWRPDGVIQYAENPPKKYEDILPINFETENWQELWRELKSIFEFWIGKGVQIFRVDNPHTKPFAFWEWLIREIKTNHPDVLLLSEAFTRPKVMYRLAKAGFTQSYTYFTWRNTKIEFAEYLTELTNSSVREFFRPSFWPNTPDILPEHLQYGGTSAFKIRLLLAATLSSSYGIYGPAFEFMLNQAVPGKEEYWESEKYEIKHWEWEKPGGLKELIAKINHIRRENKALQRTNNISFVQVDNNYILGYLKTVEDYANMLLIAVNLDPQHTQSATIHVPVNEMGIPPDQSYLVHDLLTDDRFIWQGEKNYIELNPDIMPAHIFRIHPRLKREHDFDYFM